MTLKRRTAALGAGAAALSIGLAGCGAAATTAHRDSPAQVAATEAATLRLYESVTGSPADREAVDYLGYRAAQRFQATCVAKHGFVYPMHPYRNRDVDYPLVAGGDSQWLAPLNSDYVSRQRLSEITFNRADFSDHMKSSRYAKNPVQNQKYIAALNACGSKGGESDAVHYPPGYELVGDYNKMIESVDASLAAHSSDYRRCMAADGVAVRSYQSLAGDIRSMVSTAARQADSAKDAALTYEQKGARVDGRCRQVAHDVGYSLIRPRLVAFEKEHQAKLARLRGYWAASRTRAVKYQNADPARVVS